jgi:hypothetical protein
MSTKKQLNLSLVHIDLNLPLATTHLEPIDSVKLIRNTTEANSTHLFYQSEVFRGEKFYKPIAKI